MMSLTAGLAPSARRLVNALGAVAVAATVALVAHDLGLLGGPALDGLFSRWVYNGIELAVCALILARALLVGIERGAWLTLAIGAAFFAAGDVYYTVALEGMAEPPTPSLSDVAYLLFYPCAYAMIVRLVSAHLRGLQASLWLDGAIGALAVAAVGATLVLEPVIHTSHGDFATITTNLAYPLGDLVLVMFAIGVFALTGWRPGRAWLLIVLGFGVLAAADGVYLFRAAEGTYAPGTILDAMWPLGLVLLAYAAWTPPGRAPEQARDGGLAMMLLPCLFAAVALFLLIRADYVHLSIVPESLAGAALLVAVIRFGLTFNEVRRLSETRERLASTDELTGLANRRSFYACLHEAVEGCRVRGASFAVLMIDLDRFKELNDTLGHQAGDRLLQQIGPRLQGVLRDEPLARLGGDEFGLILRDAGAAALVAERLHRTLREPFALEDLDIAVNASVGIAVFPTDADSASGLLQRADVAMYEAKAARTRYSFYAPGVDRNSRERLGLVAELGDAIEHGGLVVHYQPQIDLRSDTVTGVEALVRWQHPQRGLLAANEFVGIAEQTGVMRELAASVLEQSLAQQRKWLAEGLELSLAVNVSATNLLDSAFLGDLEAQLGRWQTPPGMLRLEMTESVLIAEGSRVRTVIDSLGGLGVRMSLDDFGTGYSPLAYLRELPVDELKIDRSFVEAMMHDRDTATIVGAVIGLARELGIDVVAEGIESDEQRALLCSLGCPHAQGYLFSPPQAAHALTSWLAQSGHARRRTPRAAPAPRLLAAGARA